MQVSATEWPNKLVLSQETGAIELFDLAEDPNETRNLADERKEKIPFLLAKLRAWDAHSRNLIENYAGILRSKGHACDVAADVTSARAALP
jgi:hypothetical protein